MFHKPQEHRQYQYAFTDNSKLPTTVLEPDVGAKWPNTAQENFLIWSRLTGQISIHSPSSNVIKVKTKLLFRYSHKGGFLMSVLNHTLNLPRQSE